MRSRAPSPERTAISNGPRAGSPSRIPRRTPRVLLAALPALVLCWGCRGPLASRTGVLNPLSRWTKTLPRTPVRPPLGLIYTDVVAPLTTQVGGESATGRTGRAATFYLMIPVSLANSALPDLDFAWGDASIQEAARNGGVRTVAFADYRMQQVLGLFGRFEVLVHGDG